MILEQPNLPFVLTRDPFMDMVWESLDELLHFHSHNLPHCVLVCTTGLRLLPLKSLLVGHCLAGSVAPPCPRLSRGLLRVGRLPLRLTILHCDGLSLRILLLLLLTVLYRPCAPCPCTCACTFCTTTAFSALACANCGHLSM